MSTIKMRIFVYLVSILFITSCSLIEGQSEESPQEHGNITFETSASGEVQREFLKGVLALHSFWYPEARDRFEETQELDPDFAMAYWGEAMTYDHPLWNQHDQEKGIEVLNRLDKKIEAGAVKWSEREKKYVQAVRYLLNPGASIDERRDQYASAMSQLVEEYPDDPEALVFQALADMSTDNFNFHDADDVDRVASNLETFLEEHPQHPGALHYLIHVYDTEEFAERALPAANKFTKIASSPHTIHMPSHIYRHLGMWQKVVDSNLKAYEASVEWQQQTGRPINDRDFHAYRWLFDGYIQLGNYEAACSQLKDLDQMFATARERGEAYGIISGTREKLTAKYQEASTPACE